MGLMKGWAANMDFQNMDPNFNQGRITRLSDIWGQPQVVNQLDFQLKAYSNMGSDNGQKRMIFGPVLLVGPSGTGKTMTAGAIHTELGNRHFIKTNGVALNAKKGLFSTLICADEKTTILIDEAQGLNAEAQYILLTALSERYLPLPGKAIGPIPLSNFTAILATTDEYLLQEALRNRMRIYCRFDFYSVEDLAEIVRHHANAEGLGVQSDIIPLSIARRAKGTPRQALDRILQTCWCMAKSQGRDVITVEDTHQAFSRLQVDDEGLDYRDRIYLNILIKESPIPLGVLSARLGLPSQTVQRVVEPYLIKAGFVTKNSSSHRVITEKGVTHMNNTGSRS